MTELRRKRSRRWRLQYSLRTLLLAVLLFSLVMSWFATKMERARKQKEAVDAIEKAGGFVLYEHEYDPCFQERQKRVPAWLRELLGDDFFFSVDLVVDYGENIKHWTELANLKKLSLLDTQIADAELEQLSGLTELEYLNVTDTQVTPAGVKKLQEALPDCEIVY